MNLFRMMAVVTAVITAGMAALVSGPKSWAQATGKAYIQSGEARQKSLEFSEDSRVEGLSRDRADLNTMSKSWKDRRKNHLYQSQKENLFREESKNTMREMRYSR